MQTSGIKLNFAILKRNKLAESTAFFFLLQYFHSQYPVFAGKEGGGATELGLSVLTQLWIPNFMNLDYHTLCIYSVIDFALSVCPSFNFHKYAWNCTYFFRAFRILNLFNFSKYDETKNTRLNFIL